MVNTDKHRPQEDLGTNPIQAAVVSVFREGGLLHWETGLHRPLPDIVCRGYIYSSRSSTVYATEPSTANRQLNQLYIVSIHEYLTVSQTAADTIQFKSLTCCI